MDLVLNYFSSFNVCEANFVEPNALFAFKSIFDRLAVYIHSPIHRYCDLPSWSHLHDGGILHFHSAFSADYRELKPCN